MSNNPGNRLRLLRAERHISQYVAASELGISFNRFWRIENGHTEATDDEKRRIAEYFGKRVSYVFSSQAA